MTFDATTFDVSLDEHYQDKLFPFRDVLLLTLLLSSSSSIFTLVSITSLTPSAIVHQRHSDQLQPIFTFYNRLSFAIKT